MRPFPSAPGFSKLLALRTGTYPVFSILLSYAHESIVVDTISFWRVGYCNGILATCNLYNKKIKLSRSPERGNE